MPIVAIHHVQITVPIALEDEARRFYCDVLMLREIEKPDSLKSRGGLWLSAGQQDLHIGVEDNVDRNTTKAHVAYLVDDLDEFRRRLQDNGVTMIESIPIPDYERFEFRDSFGNRVELIQRTANEPQIHADERR